MRAKLSQGQTLLRHWEEADLPVLQALRNNFPLQKQLMAHPKISSLEQVRLWLESKTEQEDTIFFVIAHAVTNEAIGYIQVVNIVNGSGKLGICIAPMIQRQGHGRAAIALIENYIKQVKALDKLTLEVLAVNRAASDLYLKLGYQLSERLPAHFLLDDHQHDVWLMEKSLAL